mgnify:CR=1 FL=1
MEALQPDESILVNNVRDLYRFKKEVARDNLKICIDFGAMARAEDTIYDYFKVFKNDIVLLISFCLALLSCLITPPGPEYSRLS